MYCSYPCLNKGCKCLRCGDALRMDFTSHPHAECGKRGVGDWLADRLEMIGAKERYLAVKLALGLPPGCRCSDRQEWLNRAGVDLGRSVAEIAAALGW